MKANDIDNFIDLIIDEMDLNFFCCIINIGIREIDGNIMKCNIIILI